MTRIHGCIAAIVLCFAASTAHAQSFYVEPYLQLVEPESAWVLWETDSDAASNPVVEEAESSMIFATDMRAPEREKWCGGQHAKSDMCRAAPTVAQRPAVDCPDASLPPH